MATLFITVFEGAGAVAMGDPIQFTEADIGVGSAVSAALAGQGRKHRYCRLFADGDCFATWGATPTATDGTDAIPLAAGVAEYFNIEAGHQVAAIQRA